LAGEGGMVEENRLQILSTTPPKVHRFKERSRNWRTPNFTRPKGARHEPVLAYPTTAYYQRVHFACWLVDICSGSGNPIMFEVYPVATHRVGMNGSNVIMSSHDGRGQPF